MKWKLLVFEFQFVPSISKIIHSVSNVNDSTWISQVWYLVLYSLIPILVIGSKANSHFSDTQLLMSYTWAKERFRNQCYSCICITMSKKSWFRKFATMKKQPEFAFVSWRHCCWERNHYQYLFLWFIMPLWLAILKILSYGTSTVFSFKKKNRIIKKYSYKYTV